MLSFAKVVKKYDHKKVLNGIDLTIHKGEFVSIIGPSGAGKSTLINVLIGAEAIQSGAITVDGFRINEMRDEELQFYRRRVGIVFQDYRLLPNKSVWENVAFALEVCGYPNNLVKEKTSQALERVGLSAHAKHFPHQLSGGEKQRVAIARALVHAPGMIVADEPTGNLDPKTALEIIKLLVELNNEGITVILTTHNKDLVNFLKRRVIKIEGGEIVKDEGQGYYS